MDLTPAEAEEIKGFIDRLTEINENPDDETVFVVVHKILTEEIQQHPSPLLKATIINSPIFIRIVDRLMPIINKEMK